LIREGEMKRGFRREQKEGDFWLERESGGPQRRSGAIGEMARGGPGRRVFLFAGNQAAIPREKRSAGMGMRKKDEKTPGPEKGEGSYFHLDPIYGKPREILGDMEENELSSSPGSVDLSTERYS